jgi:phosphoribosylglycinamide formyltransferase-1
MRLGFLASNSGSSMQAIIAACDARVLSADPVMVVSNKWDAPALAFARGHGIATACLPTARNPSMADAMLADALARVAQADLIILSGYLRKLGPLTLERFAGRILNIHPALLPRHGGPGMYGRRVHEAVLAAGDTVSGATVHLVDGEYDHGEAITRVEVPVLPDDGPADLERRVMAAEPKLFVETLQRLVAGTLQLPEVS